MRAWLRRFRRLSDQEFASEIEAHLVHETDDEVARGVDPEEARYAALRRFGNVTRHLERFRETSPWFWLETLRSDARYGWRSIRRSPALLFAAILSLAIGIGGSTAIFSVAYATVIDPLPFPRSDRLAVLVQSDPRRSGEPGVAYVRASELAEYARLTSVFQGVAGVAATFSYVNDSDTAMQVLVATCNLFEVLDVRAQIGRTPQPSDCTPGAPPVVVLSHRIWTSRFGADPAVVGRTIRVDGLGGNVPRDRRDRTVIGVMPERVMYWEEVAWIPTGVASGNTTPSVWHPVGRLRDGVSYSQATAQVATLGKHLVDVRSGERGDPRVSYGLAAKNERAVFQYRSTMWALVGAVSCVLFLSCLNVAMLLFARATARQTEMGLRVSLGATTRRVVQQLLVESLLLSVCGGVAGIGLAGALMPLLSQLISATEIVAPQAAIGLNAPALVSAGAVVILATVMFGLAPALHALRRDPARSLVVSSRTASAAGNARWRTVLVAGQVALAFPLLCTAIALLLSLISLTRAAARYQPEHVIEATLSWADLDRAPYDSDEKLEQLVRDLERSIEAIPGVTSTATTMPALLYRVQPSVLQPSGSSDSPRWTAQLRSASVHYFSTLRIPLLSGRTFVGADDDSRRRVAIVSRAFVRAYLPGVNPLGRTLHVNDTVSWLQPLGPEPLEIVGVVDDIPLPDDENDNAVGVVPTVYVPRALAAVRAADILVRTERPSAEAAREIRRAIAKVDPNFVPWMRPLQDVIAREWAAWPRLVVSAAGSFAGVGVVLVLVGLFGVLSYTIAQLTREIGVRIALGASPARIRRQVLGLGLRWVTVGLAVGVIATAALYTIARNYVWGLSGLDLGLLTIVAGLVLPVAAVTSWLPARRAMRVDPVVVLRAE